MHVQVQEATVECRAWGRGLTGWTTQPAGVYLSITNRSATRTLFVRLYLAHFGRFFPRFFAVLSVLTPGIQQAAPKDRGGGSVTVQNGRQKSGHRRSLEE